MRKGFIPIVRLFYSHVIEVVSLHGDKLKSPILSNNSRLQRQRRTPEVTHFKLLANLPNMTGSAQSAEMREGFLMDDFGFRTGMFGSSTPILPDLACSLPPLLEGPSNRTSSYPVPILSFLVTNQNSCLRQSRCPFSWFEHVSWWQSMLSACACPLLRLSGECLLLDCT